MRPDKKGLKMKKQFVLGFVFLWILNLGYLSCEEFPAISMGQIPYPIVGTHQSQYFNESGKEISPPLPGSSLFGQDAHYPGLSPSYQKNGDGTITDLNTALMWTRDPGPKKKYSEIVAGASTCTIGGYSDWRLPSIKELYSLILFSGMDPDPRNINTANLKPFIDQRYFLFQYGKPEEGDRIIDSQYATSSIYRSTTMNGSKTMFGVNFADGRIKGYPIEARGPMGEKKYYVHYVRGNPYYGNNRFSDNEDGTITDLTTGLMWMKIDSGTLKAGDQKDGKLNWYQALEWAENLSYADYNDWRLPNAKELQSIVDYSRCPDTTNSAAIDPVFQSSEILNEAGKKDYPFYWTNTTHINGQGGLSAVYITFGRALGWMAPPNGGKKSLLDVHGAGAQRSDPKKGNPDNYPEGHGPQGDVIRIYHMVRCVRKG